MWPQADYYPVPPSTTLGPSMYASLPQSLSAQSEVEDQKGGMPCGYRVDGVVPPVATPSTAPSSGTAPFPDPAASVHPSGQSVDTNLPSVANFNVSMGQNATFPLSDASLHPISAWPTSAYVSQQQVGDVSLADQKQTIALPPRFPPEALLPNSQHHIQAVNQAVSSGTSPYAASHIAYQQHQQHLANPNGNLCVTDLSGNHVVPSTDPSGGFNLSEVAGNMNGAPLNLHNSQHSEQFQGTKGGPFDGSIYAWNALQQGAAVDANMHFIAPNQVNSAWIRGANGSAESLQNFTTPEHSEGSPFLPRMGGERMANFVLPPINMPPPNFYRQQPAPNQSQGAPFMSLSSALPSYGGGRGNGSSSAWQGGPRGGQQSAQALSWRNGSQTGGSGYQPAAKNHHKRINNGGSNYQNSRRSDFKRDENGDIIVPSISSGKGSYAQRLKLREEAAKAAEAERQKKLTAPPLTQDQPVLNSGQQHGVSGVPTRPPATGARGPRSPEIQAVLAQTAKMFHAMNVDGSASSSYALQSDFVEERGQDGGHSQPPQTLLAAAKPDSAQDVVHSSVTCEFATASGEVGAAEAAVSQQKSPAGNSVNSGKLGSRFVPAKSSPPSHGQPLSNSGQREQKNNGVGGSAPSQPAQRRDGRPVSREVKGAEVNRQQQVPLAEKAFHFCPP